MLCIKYKINLWEYFKVINDYSCQGNSIVVNVLNLHLLLQV